MASEQSMYRTGEGAGTGTSAWAGGLILFAAVFMVVGGSFHAIQGLAVLINEDFFTQIEGYAYDIDVTSWGWMHLGTGIVVAITGVTLLSGAIWARLIALFIVVVSAIINFIYIPYQPVWSIVLLVINGAIIWALLTYPEPEGGAS